MKTIICFSAIFASLSLIALTSCQDQQAKEQQARSKELENKKASNMEVVKRFYTHLDKFLNQDDQKAFKNLWASDSKRFGGSSDESMSIEDMTPFLAMYYTAFPDLEHHIVNMIADDDFVVVQLKYTGTQLGEFMGIAPTHKKIDCRGIHIFKLNAGKVAELHFLDDDFTMFSQLGHQPK